MPEYIEREAANEACREAVRRCPNSFYNGIEAARDAIRKLPAADVRPVVKARWKPVMCAGNPNIQDRDEWYGDLFVCEKCNWTMIGKSNFCHNCGADMRPEPPKEDKP